LAYRATVEVATPAWTLLRRRLFRALLEPAVGGGEIGRADVGQAGGAEVGVHRVDHALDVQAGAVAAGVAVEPALRIGTEGVAAENLRDLSDQVGSEEGQLVLGLLVGADAAAGVGAAA